jgi:hypothetical protein
MTMYGGLYLNDLGSFQICRNYNFSDYGIITVNLTMVPLSIYLGACLPSECSQ